MTKLGDFEKGGGKIAVPEGLYRFRTSDFKGVVGTKSGAPYVVVDNVVVSAATGKETVGKHFEMGFSLSPNAQSIAYAWLTAMGLTDADEVPTEDPEELERFLKQKCKGKYLEAHIEKGKNDQGYDNNGVTPPWEIWGIDLTAEEAEAYNGIGTKDNSGEELPAWAK